MKFRSTYEYVKNSDADFHVDRSMTEKVYQLGRDRLDPGLGDMDFLILRARSRLFSQWLAPLQGPLRVLDVGGRIQPYRAIVQDRVERYLAVDPLPTGLVDAIAVGERLPFQDGCFDLALCAQVLTYVSDPFRVIDEIHRVLKPGGVFLLSAPAFFPWHHDEHWRFLPDGLRILLRNFTDVEIAPEGQSVAGLFRTFNVLLTILMRGRVAEFLLAHSLIPLANLAGLALDRFSFGNEQFTANNSVRARK